MHRNGYGCNSVPVNMERTLGAPSRKIGPTKMAKVNRNTSAPTFSKPNWKPPWLRSGKHVRMRYMINYAGLTALGTPEQPTHKIEKKDD